MGWKNIKDYYKIDAIVQVTQGTIRIGNIDEITVSTDGKILTAKNYYCDGDLRRVLTEMRSDPEKLRSLTTSPDQFGALITVWTYDRNSLIEKQSEVVGWPNCCTDGTLQKDNTHSTDRAIVLRWAIDNAIARLGQCSVSVDQKIEQLQQARNRYEEAYRDLNKLEAET